jgi:hypothetical protein
MADFLSRLAERTLSIRPAIRADLSAQLGQAPVVEAATMPESPNAEWPVGPLHDRAPSTHLDLQSPAGEPSRAQEPRAAEPAALPPASAMPPWDGSTLLHATAMPIWSEPASPTTRVAESASDPTTAVARVRDAVADDDTVRIRRRIDESNRTSANPEPKARSIVADPIALPARPPRHPLDRESGTPEKSDTGALRVIPRQHIQAPLIGFGAVPGPHSSQDQRPRTVHVSIGRIDVRAVMPPVAPPPPVERKVSAGMTLEAYLRERNRGRA